MAVVSTNLNAQSASKKELKKIEKKEKILNKKIKSKAVRAARIEAKKLIKQGFLAPVGKLPIDKQIEKSWQVQYEQDKDGYPAYITGSARVIAGSHTAGTLQATTTAKMDIAGQIQSKIAMLIQTKLSTKEINQSEASSINSLISAGKSAISTTLGRTIPLVELYRVLPNKNIEVIITLAYNSDLAMKEAVKAIKGNLEDESTELMNKLENFLKK